MVTRMQVQQTRIRSVLEVLLRYSQLKRDHEAAELAHMPASYWLSEDHLVGKKKGEKTSPPCLLGGGARISRNRILRPQPK